MKLLGISKKKGLEQDAQVSLFQEVIKCTIKEHGKENRYAYDLKTSSLEVYQQKVSKWPVKTKVDFILFNIDKILEDRMAKKAENIFSCPKNIVNICYIKQLLKTKLILKEEEVEKLLKAFTLDKKGDRFSFPRLPHGFLINQVHKQYKTKHISDRLKNTLSDFMDTIKQLPAGYAEREKDKANWISKIEDILFSGKEDELAVKPAYFSGNDDFSEHANHSVSIMPQESKNSWYKLIAHAKKAKGSKPSKKFLEEAKANIKVIGNEAFKAVVHDWFKFITFLKERSQEQHYTSSGYLYTYTEFTFISAVNAGPIKGFIWMCSQFHGHETLNTLARLAERSYKKIPGKCPAAAGIGNACIFALYKSKGLDGVGHLSRLKLRIKQANTQALISNYLTAAANERGISLAEIEDMAVEGFGLKDGAKEYKLEGFTAEISIEKIGKVSLKWFKEDGSEQKSIPKAVKDKQAAKLKKIKETVRQVGQTVSAQRDRVDRMFKTDRMWQWEAFKTYYLDHGLMSFLTNRLIWNFYFNNTKQAVVFMDGGWRNLAGETIPTEQVEAVSLWHPALASTEEIRKWRSVILENEIKQPVKQAFREIYLLTEAEERTKTYSNRMAAHILKQHQFNSLAKVRGWRYSLMGAFDNGVYSDAASITLPEYNLKAEFWINEINAEEAINDVGIWSYIATDQIRFMKIGESEPIDLREIPTVLFSEILRDVDLFVGVASIGNDPAWQDAGGMPRYRDYWESYSFGNLSELAKTRKELLSDLIPRLKINKIAQINGNFLVVKGKLRTYKIHMGSTNILMEPNDQYLCIVPDRKAKGTTGNLFLPFEGDNGSSIILSKAFLLAEDDKITDSTITSQIKRK